MIEAAHWTSRLFVLRPLVRERATDPKKVESNKKPAALQRASVS